MTDQTDAMFYALSTIGYGCAPTPEEATELYYQTQARNFPSLHRTIKGRIAKLKEIAKPTVFEAPADATGFVIDGFQVFWDLDDGSRIRCASDPVPCKDTTSEPAA